MKTLTLDISHRVATLAFNRPHALNALTTEVIEEFDQALDIITAPDSQARCLLLTGHGRGFSSGADLAAGDLNSGLADLARFDAGRTLETHFNPVIERLMALPIPFVTAVNGPAAGAGCSFAIAGDIVIAARSAYFLQAFINIGLVPDVGSTWLLPRLIGKARAQAMMMLGERISAETAHSWGLVYEVVDDDALMTRANEIAVRLASGPTQALGMVRRMAAQSHDNSFTEQLHLERICQRDAGRTVDFAEGVAAFLGRRPAQFSGR